MADIEWVYKRLGGFINNLQKSTPHALHRVFTLIQYRFNSTKAKRIR